MPEDLKVSQIGSSPLPPPFRGLHSPGVRKHCQIIFACYFRKSSIWCLAPSQPLHLYEAGGHKGWYLSDKRLNASTFPFALTTQFRLHREAASPLKTAGYDRMRFEPSSSSSTIQRKRLVCQRLKARENGETPEREETIIACPALVRSHFLPSRFPGSCIAFQMHGCQHK